MDLDNLTKLYLGDQVVSAAGEITSTDGKRVSHFGVFTPLTISRGISGSCSLLKSGDNVLTLDSINTYSEGTSIIGTRGGLVAAVPGALGSGGVSVASGTSLAVSGGTTVGNNVTGTGEGTSAIGVFSQSLRGFLQSVGVGTAVITGNISVTGTSARIGSQDGSTLDLQGSITSTTANILFRSSSTGGNYIILSGSGNSWPNDTRVFGGSVNSGIRLGRTNALPTSVGLTTVTSGSSFNLDLNGYDQTFRSLVNSVSSVLRIDNKVAGTTSTLTLNPPTGTSVFNSIISDGPSGGKVSIVKNGNGAQTLSGSNPFSGGLTINAGLITAAVSNAIGSGPLNVFGGTLDLSAGSNQSVGAVTLGNGTITGSGTLTGSSYTATNSGAASVAAILGGSGAFTQSGAGTTTLSANNSYSGGTTLNAGQLNANTAFAFGTGGLTINGGALGNTSGSPKNISNPITINGNFTFSGEANLIASAASVVFGISPTITVTANTLSLVGAIAGNFSITKDGNGALSLGGTNTYNGGVTLNAGQLNINNNSALGTGTLTIAGGTINNTSGAARTITNAINLNADTTFVGTSSLTQTTGAITLNANRQIAVSASNLSLGGVISGPGFALTKAGAGTLTLSGVNTYSGGTIIREGWLSIQTAASVGSGTITMAGGGLRLVTATTYNNPLAFSANTISEIANSVGTVTLSGEISGSGTMQLSNSQRLNLQGSGSSFTGTLLKAATGRIDLYSGFSSGSASYVLNAGTTYFQSGNHVFGSLSGSGGIINAVGTPMTLTVGALGLNDSYVGNISENSTGNTLTLVKIGSGTLALAGTSTYRGGTTISGGTIAVGSASALGTGAVTVNAGGTLRLNGFTITNTIVNNGGTVIP
jgi:autotransporter-associated beta strand protein